MADMPFNIALGRAVEYYNRVVSNDPANAAFIVVLLQANVVDDTLADFDDLSALLGDGGNTEATFTNYARKVLTDSDLAALPAPDDTNNRFDLDLPDQTWSVAGGAANNTLTKLLICYDSDTTGGTDANIVPVAHYDFALTTDSSDITAQINAAGFYRASR
jgi:hypothetical protein